MKNDITPTRLSLPFEVVNEEDLYTCLVIVINNEDYWEYEHVTEREFYTNLVAEI